MNKMAIARRFSPLYSSKYSWEYCAVRLCVLDITKPRRMIVGDDSLPNTLLTNRLWKVTTGMSCVSREHKSVWQGGNVVGALQSFSMKWTTWFLPRKRYKLRTSGGSHDGCMKIDAPRGLWISAGCIVRSLLDYWNRQTGSIVRLQILSGNIKRGIQSINDDGGSTTNGNIRAAYAQGCVPSVFVRSSMHMQWYDTS